MLLNPKKSLILKPPPLKEIIMFAFCVGFLLGFVLAVLVRGYIDSTKGKEEVAEVKADATVAAEAVTTAADDVKKAV